MKTIYNDINLLLEKRYIRHILFWFAYIIVLTYVHGLSVQGGDYFPWLMNYLFELPVILGLTYSIGYWAIPRFLLHKRYYSGILLIFMLFILFSSLNLLIYNWVILPLFFDVSMDPMDLNNILRNAFALLFPVVVFLTIRQIKYNAGRQDYNYQSQQKLLKSELDLMKSKMYPVFLRDSLDEVFRVADDKPELIPEMILSISELLQYFLYECAEERVLLRKEEQAMRIFMRFAKLSNQEHFDYDMNIQGPIDHTKIHPYIIFPLLRAVYRFNPDFRQNPGKIFIQMEGSEGKVYLSISQKISGNKPVLGIDYAWNEEINMSRKRLDLIYTWKYKLDVLETERKLMVNLFLDLTDNEHQNNENTLPDS